MVTSSESSSGLKSADCAANQFVVGPRNKFILHDYYNEDDARVCGKEMRLKVQRLCSRLRGQIYRCGRVLVCLGLKKRHCLEPNKYPYVSPSEVELRYNDDITDTARYPLVKAHGLYYYYCKQYTTTTTTTTTTTNYYKLELLGASHAIRVARAALETVVSAVWNLLSLTETDYGRPVDTCRHYSTICMPKIEYIYLFNIHSFI